MSLRTHTRRIIKGFLFILAKGKGRNRDVIIWALYLKKIGLRMAAGRGIPFFVLRWFCGCGGGEAVMANGR